WVAKLRGERVRFLEEPYRLGDTRAVMIEGPSREALELVEVRERAAYTAPRRSMKSSVACAQRSASLAATWKELPGITSSSESRIVCCQARVSSTDARPLWSVVTTSVGQVIRGRSARISE